MIIWVQNDHVGWGDGYRGGGSGMHKSVENSDIFDFIGVKSAHLCNRAGYSIILVLMCS